MKQKEVKEDSDLIAQYIEKENEYKQTIQQLNDDLEKKLQTKDIIFNEQKTQIQSYLSQINKLKMKEKQKEKVMESKEDTELLKQKEENEKLQKEKEFTELNIQLKKEKELREQYEIQSQDEKEKEEKERKELMKNIQK
eukprot:507661_1